MGMISSIGYIGWSIHTVDDPVSVTDTGMAMAKRDVRISGARSGKAYAPAS